MNAFFNFIFVVALILFYFIIEIFLIIVNSLVRKKVYSLYLLLFADTMTPFKRYDLLLELIEMYPCLYNKQEKDFKNEEVKQRAWKEIAK